MTYLVCGEVIVLYYWWQRYKEINSALNCSVELLLIMVLMGPGTYIFYSQGWFRRRKTWNILMLQKMMLLNMITCCDMWFLWYKGPLGHIKICWLHASLCLNFTSTFVLMILPWKRITNILASENLYYSSSNSLLYLHNVGIRWIARSSIQI